MKSKALLSGATFALLLTLTLTQLSLVRAQAGDLVTGPITSPITGPETSPTPTPTATPTSTPSATPSATPTPIASPTPGVSSFWIFGTVYRHQNISFRFFWFNINFTLTLPDDGATISVTGDSTGTAQAVGGGIFAISEPKGNYTVTPGDSEGDTFMPSSSSVNLNHNVFLNFIGSK